MSKEMSIEVFEQLLDIVEYQLLDGANMPYIVRKFTMEEHETIRGVVQYTRNTLHNTRMLELAEKYAKIGAKK